MKLNLTTRKTSANWKRRRNKVHSNGNRNVIIPYLSHSNWFCSETISLRLSSSFQKILRSFEMIFFRPCLCNGRTKQYRNRACFKNQIYQMCQTVWWENLLKESGGRGKDDRWGVFAVIMNRIVTRMDFPLSVSPSSLYFPRLIALSTKNQTDENYFDCLPISSWTKKKNYSSIRISFSSFSAGKRSQRPQKSQHPSPKSFVKKNIIPQI